MDHIIQALERANTTEGTNPVAPRSLGMPPTGDLARRQQPVLRRDNVQITDAEVSAHHLERMRIVAHDPGHPIAKSFEILRTQILRIMETNGWKLLAITSPTPGCGKTFVALNLALSIARQPDSSVLVVDIDLQKPQVAHRLGIKRESGLRSLIEGHTSVAESITRVSASGLKFGILPCERSTSRASDWTGSPQMISALRRVRQDSGYRIVILDLPPLLTGDEAISVLPNVDCVLMVAAAGATKEQELKDSAVYLNSVPVIKIIFNRAAGPSPGYY